MTSSPAPCCPRAGELAVEIRDLEVSFSGYPVLRGVNLQVQHGELLALIGPNGCGKTTLLRCLLGLEKEATGFIQLLGVSDLKQSMPRIGYVPQRLALESGFILSVREFLALRLRKTRHWFFSAHQATDDVLRSCLSELGIESLFDRPLAQLSGGQLQRVLIAFSLLQKPELLLLDEPTAGVDALGEQSFYEMISEIQRRHHLTAILVSHDLSMVYRHATRVAALGKGVICCEGTPEQVMNAESLKEAYGLQMTPYHHHHH